MDFRWTPNKPLDPRIPERMRAAFPMPSEPPPEAWFMDPSTQNYYFGLFEAAIEQDGKMLYGYLFDTGGGIKNFGRFDIWVRWFLCILPYLVEMCYDIDDGIHSSGFQPHIVNYLLNMYPDGIVEEYSGFRDDLLESVGQVAMSRKWWSSPDTLNEFFADTRNHTMRFEEWYVRIHTYGWLSNLLCSMFFCLKYLHKTEIDGWVDSIAAGNSLEWRQSVTQWLIGFRMMQYLLDHPEDVEAFRTVPPHKRYQPQDLNTADHLLNVTNLSWDESFLVFDSRPASMLKTFFPPDNLAAFWDAVHRHDWLREAVSGGAE